MENVDLLRTTVSSSDRGGGEGTPVQLEVRNKRCFTVCRHLLESGSPGRWDSIFFSVINPKVRNREGNLVFGRSWINTSQTGKSEFTVTI